MMLVKRFYDVKLAQASYLIASTDTGEAIVIDANRDIDQYLRAAADEGVAITHVTETHIHADFVSGSRDLAARTGAVLYLSDEGDAGWKYAFAAEAGAVLLEDGDIFHVGSVRLQALHTPGHTPEHLMFLVTDTATAGEPVAAVTGDFLFVGDVGRPDLLERAAGIGGTMEAAARALFHSLARLGGYPDYLQIWPGHGAGSACGKGIGSLPQTTLGYERRFNWALQIEDEDEFVRRVLSGQPEPPRYFAEMKRVNKEGPVPLRNVRPPRLSLARLAGPAAHALVVDTRPAADYAAAHVPGTVNIPLNRAFTTWAGSLVAHTRDFYLIVDDRCSHCLDEAVRDLALIGLDRIAGYFGADVIGQWGAAGRTLGHLGHVDAASLSSQLGAHAVRVIDVRSAVEWDAGHIPGALHIPLGDLPERIASLPVDRPLVVHCQAGARSAIAASLLSGQSPAEVVSLEGGFDAWQAAGYPVEPGMGQPETGRAGATGRTART